MMTNDMTTPTPPAAPTTARAGSGDLNDMQRTVTEWAARTFPRENPGNVLLHFNEEAAELAKATDPAHIREEAADVLLLLVQVANHNGFSLAEAAAEKFAVVSSQQWVWREDLGYYKRVKTEPR